MHGTGRDEHVETEGRGSQRSGECVNPQNLDSEKDETVVGDEGMTDSRGPNSRAATAI